MNERGEFKLNVVPAGIFYPEKTCVIGNGVAVDPAVLLSEIEGLEAKGINTSRLVLSDRANVIMPWHRELDRLDELARGDKAIGTTGKGVGPCFVDKVARRGIRVCDLLRVEDLRPRMRAALDFHNKVITSVYGGEPLDFDACCAQYTEFGQRLAAWVGDVQEMVLEAHRRGEYVLLEGAQGSLLDLDHGTYPYVTSSVPSSSSSGARPGRGRRPNRYQARCRRLQELQHARRQRTLPHGTVRRHGDTASRPRQGVRPRRVRHYHRPPAPHRLARCRRLPL